MSALKDLAPVIAAIVGTLLGLGAGLLTASLQHRRDLSVKLLEQFFEVRKDVVTVLAPLTALDVTVPRDPSVEQSDRDRVAELYYKHFDFLPKPVLDSLVRLEICLDSPSRGPISLRNNAASPMKDEDIPPFILECALLRNAQYSAPLALKSSSPSVRHNQAVKLHARHVLLRLNECASVEGLLGMLKSLKKVSGRTTTAELRLKSRA